MADEDDLAAFVEMALGLDMNLGDKGAGGIQEEHLAVARIGGHRLRHAMR